MSLKASDHFICSHGHSPQGQSHLISLGSYSPGTGGLGAVFLSSVLETSFVRTSVVCPVTVDFAPSSPAAEVAGRVGTGQSLAALLVCGLKLEVASSFPCPLFLSSLQH